MLYCRIASMYNEVAKGRVAGLVIMTAQKRSIGNVQGSEEGQVSGKKVNFAAYIATSSSRYSNLTTLGNF